MSGRLLQDRERPLLLRRVLGEIFPGGLRRDALHHRELPHPAPQVPPHGVVAQPRIQKAGLKSPELPETVLRAVRADPVQKFI